MIEFMMGTFVVGIIMSVIIDVWYERKEPVDRGPMRPRDGKEWKDLPRSFYTGDED